MKNHLGIDHPLIAVKDMDNACKDFEKLGFFINPRHHHPWGTDNHLLMFPENFIEVISIYDHTKLDLTNEKGFAFGRFISDSLEHREGISLVALHSEDAREDHAIIEERKLENQGIVDFRRTAHRPDGTEEEAVVSLVMLINSEFPAVSQFFCHQHKPDLVWVKEWMDHPNGANGITRVSYVAEEPKALKDRFTKLYGPEAVTVNESYIKVQTGRGSFEFMTPSFALNRFEGVDLPLNHQQLPHGVAIRISTHSITKATQCLDSNQVQYVKTNDGGLRIPSSYAGNTIIEIYPENSKVT